LTVYVRPPTLSLASSTRTLSLCFSSCLAALKPLLENNYIYRRILSMRVYKKTVF